MSNRKLNVFLPLLFAVVLALGMFLGHKMPGSGNNGTTVFFTKPSRGPLQEVMDLIKTKYVDTLNTDKLQQEAIEGLLSKLDPHSIYIIPEELQRVTEDMDGNFEGIGVEFNITNDTVNVVSVLSGGPSETAGVQTGDKILKVNDTLVAGNSITAEKIRRLLRGPAGSIVNTQVLRQQKTITIPIKRGVIPLYSVDAAYMAAPTVGYIKISRFSATTYDEFMKAMRQLTQQGMKELIIDLRQNPGGYLDAAVRVADELLDENKLIVYTKGKDFPRADYKTKRPGLFEKGALAILTDEGSASASEILAGAIQDWDRGAIIGRRTFGKGLVQEQYDLDNGGALRLTVARYYIPSGRSIQKPYGKGHDDYNDDIMERLNHGELVNKDSIKINDTVPYKTAGGRRVYGGGGITPDFFIPFDTARFTPTLTAIYTRNTFGNFAYQYYTNHRETFKAYKDAAAFVKGFQPTGELMNEFLSFAKKDSIPGLDRLSAKDENEIRVRLKAMLARQLFRTEGFYETINQDDPMVKKALEVVLDKSSTP
ncbi:carboxyl-terminal processing protease [Chitinophaga terrae (ex Kim and Jung 2007)]|uniref:S41 family peptidase n=1 Tax=Chitinophaga terrae (ex Kim and Jung 2007) TaxID=408074 RepID=UPI00278461A0|nr:S41 family peptidase [Chitinophaga terrae (ex Kim and Jung 2007)]MDQ0108535.1 carboxyl-terminal processing protease [Chitinophaga terrae (ex Kim and Jung 2007)]